jgi:hypothetical protein
MVHRFLGTETRKKKKVEKSVPFYIPSIIGTPECLLILHWPGVQKQHLIQMDCIATNAVLNDIKQDKEFFIGQFISGLYSI